MNFPFIKEKFNDIITSWNQKLNDLKTFLTTISAINKNITSTKPFIDEILQDPSTVSDVDIQNLANFLLVVVPNNGKLHSNFLLSSSAFSQI